MPPRSPGAGAVPEVDWEGPIREIEVGDSVGGEDSEETCQESGASCVTVGERSHLVDPRSTAFAHADVLDDSRRDHRIEEAVGEGKEQRVRDDETVPALSGAPLPLAEGGEVVPPGFEPCFREKVDRLAVPAARVENAPGARRTQEREVVVLDPATRVLVLVSAACLLGEGRGVRVVIEVPPFRKIGDPFLDRESSPARNARQRGRRALERASTGGADQPEDALAGSLFHSQKCLFGACLER